MARDILGIPSNALLPLGLGLGVVVAIFLRGWVLLQQLQPPAWNA